MASPRPYACRQTHLHRPCAVMILWTLSTGCLVALPIGALLEQPSAGTPVSGRKRP
ncbi:hypothetical protein IFR09_09870 [Pseudomonas syringae]|nr:hypothetical protein [Pseudomonas syringae]MBD8575695.1 hypothetical protein [Pseudomonas syringae]MBD8788526.1 hypothetical protein [Pseudomonas syringae]MBD8801584.1 hypothetical protein [Pseudomonas syringae]MBD8811471.1 hypothetical protein [Pseudomonas syringae]